ncbi:hypothetical protein CC80DRAFT_40280 [Byssothecium circinans]|uniref:Uncharacterized protein n=1 Tax=Byssothecium circinans TaxID=147558 RepID=A0A6A5U2K5_9PLEO|nr:hypothetical protein CC80DRAFT_40280 [Byssothecium circinans]
MIILNRQYLAMNLSQFQRSRLVALIRSTVSIKCPRLFTFVSYTDSQRYSPHGQPPIAASIALMDEGGEEKNQVSPPTGTLTPYNDHPSSKSLHSGSVSNLGTRQACPICVRIISSPSMVLGQATEAPMGYSSIPKWPCMRLALNPSPRSHKQMFVATMSSLLGRPIPRYLPHVSAMANQTRSAELDCDSRH